VILILKIKEVCITSYDHSYGKQILLFEKTVLKKFLLDMRNDDKITSGIIL